MVTHKVLCLGSLIGFIPLLYQPHIAALEMSNTITPLDLSRQAAQTQRNGIYTPSDDTPPIAEEDHIGGGPRAYSPPTDSRIPEEDHSGGGVRGCGEELVAIAPRLSHVGQTLATHPTLVWYSQNDSDEFLELQLYRFDDNNDLEEIFIRPIQPIEANRPGYKAYALPQGEPGLSVGDTYLWQVVQYCDPNLEEVGAVTSAEIEVVPRAIAADAAEDSLRNAQTYAELGLWYDAIAQVYDARTPAEERFRQDLLSDVIALEAQTEEASTSAIVIQLRQISDMP